MDEVIAQALNEDIGSGDITANLMPNQRVDAKMITREPMCMCGQEWVSAVFQQVCTETKLEWLVKEGEEVDANTVLVQLSGRLPAILSAERVALNFLQWLAGIATETRRYVKAIEGTSAQILDTRKTVPLLRKAQRYAVRCGGGVNHRFGLYDAFLVKENHWRHTKDRAALVAQARMMHSAVPLIVEVESLAELVAVLPLSVDRILLDNFSVAKVKEAVTLVNNQCPLEVSGNLNLETVAAYARTGIDYLSIGALTKQVRAIDLSLQILAKR